MKENKTGVKMHYNDKARASLWLKLKLNREDAILISFKLCRTSI